ncbi:zinc-binding dehydrogenase [Microbacterium sp. MPKO10]|uniref:zinc-binding dehydrogenase n=1 Tax=Microbacterium sp. MPKO10 TaxID=2989818 RepID=UPI002235439C|nr:zinc-binding dehydrogenase [Microbacterium sp. MPKO10]MCW4457676.1 alcohol dehydrogenase catalytic domain-containing protein [Microbacterium sp. MPKO10]
MTNVSGLAFPGNRVAELRDFVIDDPGPTEVQIMVKASGICGSDLHTYDSRSGLRAYGPDDPRVLGEPRTGRLLIGGHEPAGIVHAVGEEVRDFAIGDRVLAYHILGCGNCLNCRRGYPVVCTSNERAAYGGERDGGHSPLLNVEQRSLIPIPDSLSFVDGAMIACGAGTAYSAIRKAGVTAGSRLLVTGLGPVGLAVAQIASDMGVEVVGSDLNPERLSGARKLGLHHGLAQSTGDAATAEIMDLTDGLGVDASIDCTGAASARALCIEAAATFGRAIFVGVGRQPLSFDPTVQVISKMLTIQGSWVSSQAEMQELTSVLAQRDLHPEALVSETFTLDEGPAAYAKFAGGATGKLVLTW